jgi:hypothetical protein
MTKRSSFVMPFPRAGATAIVDILDHLPMRINKQVSCTPILSRLHRKIGFKVTSSRNFAQYDFRLSDLPPMVVMQRNNRLLCFRRAD